MKTVHLVSHTHWDREWYQPLQVFRLRLVHLVDNLLSILEQDSEYHHFMLDGQTIVLDDYLEMRPDARQQLRHLVQKDRLLVGPWYVLPDEFLVSPEALIRNLSEGTRAAELFGGCMPVGYIPDTFGHIGQLPQILSGFGFQFAALRRGLSDEPAEVWWAAPDGSRVFTAYLRDGYDNAVNIPCDDVEQFTTEVTRLWGKLEPYAMTSHFLLMHGSDHVEPNPATTTAIRDANERLIGISLIHSTLPNYFQSAWNEVRDNGIEIPIITGELRSPKRHHLVSGVLSSRTWIKQRNAEMQTLLERWVEPHTAIAQALQPVMLPTRANRLDDPAPLLRQGWRYLMQNHPHDSICGCSIDRVHQEMRPRFDNVEQIGTFLLDQSLSFLSSQVDTSGSGDALGAIVAFNPNDTPLAGVVETKIPHFLDAAELIVSDYKGEPLLCELIAEPETDSTLSQIAYMELDRDALMGMVSALQTGPVAGFVLSDASFRRVGMDTLFMDVIMVAGSIPSPDTVSRLKRHFDPFLNDPNISKFVIQASTPGFQQMRIVVPEIPAHGWRTCHIFRSNQHPPEADFDSMGDEIENEQYIVHANRKDGTFTITDRASGKVYHQLNFFTDGGDCGDLYNYMPPPDDPMIDSRGCGNIKVEYRRTTTFQEVTVRICLPIPAGLASSRSKRSEENRNLTIESTARLSPGQSWIAFITRVNNTATNHRLRVHFPLPFRANSAHYDGHFEVVERPATLPTFDQTWMEQPSHEQPQRFFCDANDGETGLMVVNRGLPEAALLTREGHQEIALTLLRCTGWLSRNDLSTRQGSAGRAIPTPGAQELGKHTFHYAIIPHKGNWESVHRLAHAFQCPPQAVFTELHSGDLPVSGCFITVDPPEFLISAIKPPDDGEGLVIRGYNTSGKHLDARITIRLPFRNAWLTNLKEEPQEPLSFGADGTICFEVNKQQVVTILFK